jgi:phage shock protein A
MAGSKKIRRQIEEVESHVRYWEEKAPIAVNKGRDDLAREALIEKRKYKEMAEALNRELSEHHTLIEEYQNDIRQLESKLAAAREKQRTLVQRHIHANRKKRAQEDIRRIESSEAISKFDELENRIERMESEADLVNFGTSPTLQEELENLSTDEEIEKELQAIKSSNVSGQDGTKRA